MSKILLCRASPRCNIPQVETENDMLPCDRFIVQYKNEYEAYKQMRDYFLSHEQYEYMVLATDDIVVKADHIRQLREDLDKGEYQVLAGMMNVNQDDAEDVNITWIFPMTDRASRHYRWIKREELPKEEIFEVSFNGFALMAIRRDVIEQYEFNTDGIFRGTGVSFGASLDFVFCHWCLEHKIKVHVDKRIDMVHLRASGTMQVGLQKPDWWFMRSYSQKRIKDTSGTTLQLKLDWEEFIKRGLFGDESQNKFIQSLMNHILNPS